MDIRDTGELARLLQALGECQEWGEERCEECCYDCYGSSCLLHLLTDAEAAIRGMMAELAKRGGVGHD
jgi:hypothetical protein